MRSPLGQNVLPICGWLLCTEVQGLFGLREAGCHDSFHWRSVQCIWHTIYVDEFHNLCLKTVPHSCPSAHLPVHLFLCSWWLICSQLLDIWRIFLLFQCKEFISFHWFDVVSDADTPLLLCAPLLSKYIYHTEEKFAEENFAILRENKYFAVLIFHLVTVCAQTVRGLNFRGFCGSGAPPRII